MADITIPELAEFSLEDLCNFKGIICWLTQFPDYLNENNFYLPISQ
jgi:hypothetical protein